MENFTSACYVTRLILSLLYILLTFVSKYDKTLLMKIMQ